MGANVLKRIWDMAEEEVRKKHLILVCNTKHSAASHTDSGGFSMDTEYYSDDEFEQVLSMFYHIGLPLDVFTYEDDFFSYVIDEKPANLLVYNSAQSGTGPGRKSLIPAFCGLHNIPITGSDAYVVSLCRQKYHVNQILSQAGFRVPEAWLYSSDHWQKSRPVFGQKILLKPIYESASIGIDNASIQLYSDSVDPFIQKRSEKLHQPIIAQEFISGYEVEVPLVRAGRHVCQLPPVGISVQEKRFLGDEILDYERIYFDRYGFYDFAAESNDLANAISDCAANAAHILGMKGLCRVDFRITENGAYYITDVSTNPHFILHSSVHCAFDLLGLSSDDIAKTILAAAVDNG